MARSLAATPVWGIFKNLVAGLGLLVLAGTGCRQAFSAPTGPYVDKERHLAPFEANNKRPSFYIQPWRGFLETVPATQMLSGIGVNYTFPPNADDATAMRVLAASGFRSIRLEIPWAAVRPDETGFTTEPRLLRIMEACKANNIVPLILLNAHHADPGPHQHSMRTVTAAASAGDRSVQLDDTSNLKPGYSGLSFPKAPMAGILIDRINGTTVELSRPLPQDIPAGTPIAVDTLRYLPLYPVGTPEFEDTVGGWLRYTRLACDLVRRSGVPRFDVEIWNELTFGSKYLNINNYVSSQIVPKKPDFLRPGGNVWELARRTTDYIHQHYPGTQVIWGFSNTVFFHTPIRELPPGVNGQSYHPYGTKRVVVSQFYPRPGAEQLYNGTFIPEGVTKCMPEGWAHLGVQVESLMPLLDPDVRHQNTPPGVDRFDHYMTEHGFSASEAGITDPAAALDYKARALVRGLLFWLNKGMKGVWIYTSYTPGDLGFGVFAADPPPKDYGNHTVADLQSPALRALARTVAAFQGAEALAAPRSLDLDVSSVGPEQIAFPGDAGHPPLYYRDMFTFLPFQVNARKFVCPVYVMSYDITHPPAIMRFRVQVRNVKGTGATVSLYDPVRDKTVPVDVVGRSGRNITLEFDTADYPYLLTIQEAG